MDVKVLLTFLSLILLTFDRRENQNREHNQFQAVDAILDVDQFVQSKFGATCQMGYKRGVSIGITNRLRNKLILKGVYEDSGKVLRRGEYQLSTGQQTLWQFVKSGYILKGSTGINVWQIEGTNTGIILFYQNPWFEWNFQGVCIRQNISFPKGYSKLDRSQLKNIYQQLKQGYGWDQNCILFDNRETQSIDWIREHQQELGGYHIISEARYRYHDRCYTASLMAQIR